MSRNIQKDIKTLAYVLRRTNYGEADRILNLITPEGKLSAIAKSARKEKSKLAGGIEMFSLVELNIHFGRTELGLVTSARMIRYYSQILVDFDRMELATLILKKISLAAEDAESPEYFTIVDESLAAIERGVALKLVEAWFWLNLARVVGEQVNLYRDAQGEKLDIEKKYGWNVEEMAFEARVNGEIDADTIKIMRLMVTTKIGVLERVKGIDEKMGAILKIARAINRL